MSDTTNETLPQEMTDALRAIVQEAKALRQIADEALATATAWLANEPARDFAWAGNYAREAGDLEAAIARLQAFRSVAYKLSAYEVKS
jgi:hypothetical protein